ncbi:MAG TPA: hypothetical protein VFM70_05920 [Salinimicrobium sp.]|nr:hypothetical protein [Salinimicrobium sp.]
MIVLKKTWTYIVIAILLLILFFKGCDSEPKKKTIEVKVPEITAELPEQKPEHKNAKDPVEVKWKEKVIEVPNPVNEELAIAYQKAKDSLERYKMYLDAIQMREFISEYEDDNLKLTLTGMVQGEVQSIKPTYTIKERTATAEVEEKETVFRLLGGVEFGNNTMLNDFRYKANLGFQNAKGNILRGSFSNENGINYIYLGYDISIFQIRR